MIDVLLDGWSLVYQVNSPAAQHLMTLIANCPSSVRYSVASPNTPPQWLPRDMRVYTIAAPNNAWGRLLWEQRLLPAAAKQCGAELLHLTRSTPSLFSSIPVVLSPSDDPMTERGSGLVDRLRAALAAGGMSRLGALLWPSDLPLLNEGGRHVTTLPPVVLDGFYAAEKITTDVLESVDLPETFILYHGSTDHANLRRLLEVWSWAAGPLGEYFPLLILSSDQQGRKEMMHDLISNSGMASSVQVLPGLAPITLPILYHRSAAVMHVGSIPPWGNTARNAIASSRAFVAVTSRDIDAVVGPAAYLAPEGDARALAAALITVVVEDSLAEQLAEAAQKRVLDWNSSKFSNELEAAYGEILSP